jgi:hypothetical protein
MANHSDVLHVDGKEAMVKKDLTLVSERPITFYLRVPASWVQAGRIPAKYNWDLDWDTVRSGSTMPPTSDRVHAAIENRYTREAMRILATQPDPVYATLSQLNYLVLSQEEAASAPWKSGGAACKRLAEDGNVTDAKPDAF